MECQRLQKLIKNWYLQVQNEAMAPGRMVAFMENHLLECDVCRTDPVVREEVNRIKIIVVPEVKAVESPEEEVEGEAEDDDPEAEDDDDDDDLDETDEEANEI